MRWRILGLLFLGRIGLGFQFQTVASVGDDLVVAFGIDYAGLGFLIGLFMAPGLFLAIPAGYLGQYFSDRIMVVLGLSALALGGIVSSLAIESSVIGLGRIFAGAGFLFTTLYFTKMVADWFEGREIATAMSILVMSWPFGIAMGQVEHVWLAETFSWHVPFQVASVYCLLAALGIFLLYKTPDDKPSTTAGPGVRLSSQEWRLVLCAASAWGVFNAAYVTYLTFGPRVLEGFGETAIAAAGMISIGSWVMIVSGALCGRIVDRFGRRDLVLSVCMGGAIASLLMLSVPGYGPGASLLFGMVGMAPAGVIMAMSGQALRPQVRAFGMGIFFTVYHAIMLVTPPIAGAILDATGSAQGPIWLAVILFALVVPLSIAFAYFKNIPSLVPEKKV